MAEIQIAKPLRLCQVKLQKEQNKRKALFYGWKAVSGGSETSPMIRRHRSDSDITEYITTGIVEFDDGRIIEVPMENIAFVRCVSGERMGLLEECRKPGPMDPRLVYGDEAGRRIKMATAKKCDRCGILYETYNTKDDHKHINGVMFLNIDNSRRYFSHNALDLCPKCSDSLMEWFEKKGDVDYGE